MRRIVFFFLFLFLLPFTPVVSSSSKPSIQRTIEYQIEYKKKKMGWNRKTEIQKGALLEVRSEMELEIPYMFFWTKTVRTKATIVYDLQKSNLPLSFEVSTLYKGVNRRLWGKMNQNILSISQQKGKGKISTKEFVRESFSATDLDYRFSQNYFDKTKTLFQRNLLLVTKRKVITQSVLRLKKEEQRNFLGKKQSVVFFRLKAGNKKSEIVLSKTGKLVEAELSHSLRIVFLKSEGY